MKWIYEKSNDNKYRYALGQVEENPKRVLFCFGINPSTACPEQTDRTIEKVKVLARNNGYDSWIMLNVYAERATNPDDMSFVQNNDYKFKNEEYIKKYVLEYFDNSDILFAYGDLISKRNYLRNNLNDIIKIIEGIGYKGRFLHLAKTRSENPVHPLYQKANSKFIVFDFYKI